MIKYNKKLIAAIVILTGLGYQTFIDIYLPGLPAISAYYKVGSSYVQLSMTLYLLGSGIAFFFYGVLGDIYGRKKLMLIGVLICSIGTVMSLVSNDINWFLFGRTLQGIGLGASILASPVLIDTLKGKTLVTAFVLYNISYSAIPVLAPYFGGLILKYYDWQVIFIVLLIYILIITVLIGFLLPETLQKKKHSSSFSTMIEDCLHILSNKQFLWITIVMTCSWGCIIVFNVLGPFLFQKTFLLTAYQYGIVTLAIGCVYMCSTFMNKILLHYFEPAFLIFVSVLTALIYSVVFVFMSVLGFDNMFMSLVITLLLSFSCGLLFVNGMTLTLPLFPFNAGLAAALQGCICVLIWTAITGIVAIFMYSQFLLSLFYFLLSISSFTILAILSLKIRITVPDHIS
ncbi:MAG: multidrug effflux MFS transporter [bacterium]|nr:multidrug effflux MFS transporter [bacterium]